MGWKDAPLVDAPRSWRDAPLAGGSAQDSYAPIPAPVMAPKESQAYTGGVLPFSVSPEGAVSFDPEAGILGPIKRAVMLPGQAMRGEFDPTSPESVPRMMEAATVMSPMSAASRAGGALAGPGAFKAVRDKGPTVKNLKGQAQKLYDEIEASNIRVRPEAFNVLVETLDTKLKSAGFHPKMHPKAAGAVEAIRDYGGAPLSMKDMGIVRRLAKSAKNSIDPDEARIGREILNHVDDAMRQIPGISEKFTTADQLWSMAKKTEALDKAIAVAKEAASGFENGLRIEFRKLLKKYHDGKLQLSPQEVDAMMSVVEGSAPANLLKGIGKLGPAPGGAGNALLAVLAGGGGYALGGPLGMGAVIGTGYGSRLGAQALTRGAAERARGVVSGAVPKKVYSPHPAREMLLRAAPAGLLNQ